MNFAKANHRKVLWLTAHDVLQRNDGSHRKDKEELRKERWLEFHDRFTSGLPGLLPLVLDLPVRFTDAPGAGAREMGVFKNARGWLRGWQLPDDEIERRAQIPDAEVVLCKRPKRLFVEVENATAKMPMVSGKRIYALAMQVK